MLSKELSLIVKGACGNMNQYPGVYTSSTVAATRNRVLRNTYILMAMTLVFSAVTAGASIALNMPMFVGLVTSITAMVLIWFVLPRTANSAAGLAVVFAITGLMGFGLGPVLSHYASLPNGSQIVMTAMGGTGAIFIGLSAYALVSRKDFSFLGGFVFAGMMVVLIAMLANIFLEMPALSLVISGVVILLMSAMILFDTGRIVNGGETNYIMATISLYLSLYNIFVSLLQLLGLAGNDD
jgi:modulator of FtsH protease